MANLQELMAMIMLPRETTTQRFIVRVTPKFGPAVVGTIRAHDAARARIFAMKAGARRFPRGFTFTVRPEPKSVYAS